ncbi:sulfite exporter TauE/SafE family protein [Peptostreptococcus equinus]|uniref:Probable membrane transporter protein n=1 Tax=Peptostreptococcus equinus TaxID=3003601 RepID=A0ABY7JP39_9FIRM|nr:sulfite exporter TauE/SafE family protein [Peptostreptococcus sp. CBA3647]WAW14249.1 sulfite exporter TauE/SafE family protein [Peptostreptococcus sp. CBA3647]
MIVKILMAVFYLAAAGTAGIMGIDIVKNKNNIGNTSASNLGKTGFIGFLTNFCDTLGIGSFGPIVALFKLLKVDIEDKDIPGTLNVSCALPVLFEAIIFTTAVKVDPITLISLVVAAAIGSYIGAGIISKMDETKIQLVMGICLFAAAMIMLITHPYFGLFAAGKTATSLTGVKLIIGIVVNFILGALMTAGVGLYAPCMAMIFLLGMDVKAAFPIMMGSCALLMPTCSIKFIKEGTYNRIASLMITIFGIIGVAIAAFLVKSADVEKLKFVIVAVILYTAYTMFTAGLRGRKRKQVSSTM